jgi:RNA polymerase sigma factor (sigma-70 family)
MSISLSRLTHLTTARTDRDLLQAYLAGGDSAALDELIHRHAGLAHRVAHEVCPAAAADVAQATLTLLVRKAATVADRESAAGWVFETARRLALKARTAAVRRAACEGRATLPRPPADPLDALTLLELRAVVAEELARLPDELRLPLVLCYWDEADQLSAAKRLGCSVSTLKRRLDAARGRLAARFARRGFAGPAVLAALVTLQTRVDAAPPTLRVDLPGFAFGKVLAAVVLMAGLAAATFGIRASVPIAADPADPPTKPVPQPLLAAARPEPVVDLYGDPLPDGAIARLGTVRFRHPDIQSIAYSPDGKTIAAGNFGSIMLWEAETGKPIARFVQKEESPEKSGELQVRHGNTFGLAFSPDGRWLLSAGSSNVRDGGFFDRGQLVLWNLAERKQTKVIELENSKKGVDQSVLAVAVSSDGRTFAAGTHSGYVFLIDGQTQKITTKVNTGTACRLSFSPDGKTLAVAAPEKFVVLLDTATGKEVKRLEVARGVRVAFGPDGNTLWVGCHGGTISRLDVQSGRSVQKFEEKGSFGLCLSLAVSPDGKTLASGGGFSGPTLWDIESGKAIELDPKGNRERPWIYGLSFAPDGKTLASGGSDGGVRVWDVATRRELHRRDEHTDGIMELSLSPDGKHAATAGGDGTVRIWNMATGRAVRSWLEDDKRSVFGVTYTPDGRSVLTYGWSGMVRLRDVTTGKEVRRFRNEEDSFGRAAMSPDGKLVAASGKNGRSISLYEVATGRTLRELSGHDSELHHLMFTPDSRRLISTADTMMGKDGKDDDRSLRVWDVATGRQMYKFDLGRPFGGVAISPDGRVVAAYGYSEDEHAGYLRFWDMISGKEIAARRMKDVKAVAFSPDGRYLAIAKAGTSPDIRDIRLVEVASSQDVQSFESGAGSVCALTFTRDGRRLISAHDDGQALVWNLGLRPAASADPDRLWRDLSSTDATVACRAAAMLASEPVTAVALLSEKLKPVAKQTGARTTAAIIADLDDPEYRVREAASRELAGRVEVDFAQLFAELATSPSAEVRKRLIDALQSAQPWPQLAAEDLRQVRAVGVLETIGTQEARRLLKAFADGDPYALLTREARAATGRLGD